MATRLEHFVQQLENSGIVASDVLDPYKTIATDPQTLARQLVERRHLTPFQAQELLQGQASSLVLGNYVVLDKIGSGGMGQVFKARHRRMDRIVAIKLLPARMMQDPASISRFEREVQAAAKLHHPNIVAAYDADEFNGIHFLAMEYVEGHDLATVVRQRGVLPYDKAVLQAARGLEFAHSQGVTHRDIKPANLLLDKKGTVKILDMGLARIATDGHAPTQVELTSTGVTMGTVAFMAPEQALDARSVDARADIYSLGCTLYFLVVGKPPYHGDSQIATLLAHREAPIPSLAAARPHVPAQLDAVFRKMIAKQAADRYSSVTDVSAALKQCLADSQVAEPTADASCRNTAADSTSPLSASTLGGRKNRRRMLLPAAGLLGSLVILAGVVVKFGGKDGTSIGDVDQPNRVNVSIAVEPGKHQAAAALPPKPAGTPITTLQNVAFKQWSQDVAAMPATQQLQAVAEKLRELNPGFDGKLTGRLGGDLPKIENDSVTELGVCTTRVSDISPLRALAKLKCLNCDGSWTNKDGQLADLSPLKGLALFHLTFNYTQVEDLSPLRGMPLSVISANGSRIADLAPLAGMSLSSLTIGGSKVADLAPLAGMQLRELSFGGTLVSDLSPLRGMPLLDLGCAAGQVQDLSPLAGLSLTAIRIKPEKIIKGMDVLRQMKSLASINVVHGGQRLDFPAAEFWQKYDRGDFKE